MKAKDYFAGRKPFLASKLRPTAPNSTHPTGLYYLPSMSQDGGTRKPLVIELSDDEDATQTRKVSSTPLVIELSDEEDATPKAQLNGKTIIKHESDLDDIPKAFNTTRALHGPTSREIPNSPTVTGLDVGQKEEFKKVNTTARLPERISSSPIPRTMTDGHHLELRRARQSEVQNEQQKGTSDIDPAFTRSAILDRYEGQVADDNTNSSIVQGAFGLKCAIPSTRSVTSTPPQIRNTKDSSNDEASSISRETAAREGQTQKDNMDLSSDRAPAIGTSADMSQRPLLSSCTHETESRVSISGNMAEEQPAIQNVPHGSHHQRPYSRPKDVLSEPLTHTEVAGPSYRAPVAYMGPGPKSEHLKRLDSACKPPVQQILSSSTKAVAPIHVSCNGTTKTSVAPSSGTSDAAETTKEASPASDNRRTMDQVILSEMDRMLQVQKRRVQEEEDERAIRAELLYQKGRLGLKNLEQQRPGIGAEVTSEALRGEENRSILGKSKLAKAMTKIIPATIQSMQPAFGDTNTHYRQGGLQSGLTTLSAGDSDNARDTTVFHGTQMLDEKHESKQHDPASSLSKLWTTSKGEPLEELLTDDRDQTEYQKTRRSRSPAWSSHSDLFIRSPSPPLAPSKRKRNQAEAVKTSHLSGGGGHERYRKHLRLDDFWGDNAKSAIARGATKRFPKAVTLKDGYFNCHQERIKALKERAEKENRAYEQKQHDGQEIDLKLDEDDGLDTTQTKPRSTVGQKGVSEETMLKWQMDEAAQAFPTPSTSENGEEQLDVPKLLYEYHVQRRIRFNGQSELEGGQTSFGPYHTIGEANAVATQKVRQYDSEDTSAIFKSGAWSYKYGKDDTGTEHHTLESGGGSIQTWVSRRIASPNEGIGIPLKAFTTPAWLYIALLSSNTPSPQTEDHSTASTSEVDHDPPNSSQDAVSGSIIKACTLLDLANRAAGEKWIEMQMATLPKDGIGEILRSEMAMNLRQELEDMEEENVSFNRKFRDARTGRETQIWVEMVEVEGPRN